VNVKKRKLPKNTFELALLKEQLTYDVRLSEQSLASEVMHVKASFTEIIKNTAIIQGQKLAIYFLTRLMNR
jgi:hypothetical protein